MTGGPILTRNADSLRPLDPGARDEQSDDETVVERAAESVERKSMAITGEVSRDLVGWLAIDPRVLGDPAAGLWAASYLAERHRHEQQLLRRLERIEAQRDELTARVATLQAENARLQQGWDDEKTSAMPRTLLTTGGGLLAGVGVELVRAGDYVIGGILLVTGLAFILGAIHWRPQTAKKS